MPCPLRCSFVAWGLLVAIGCSSSSTTSVTGPTSVRCNVGLSASAQSVAASGGTGQLIIAVDRECAWTARTDVDWIALTSASSGQGESTVGYTVSANPLVAARVGGIAVNEQRLEIAQAASPCVFTLGTSGDTFGASGGTRTIPVAAQASCVWSAASQVDWITVVEGHTGSGDGRVTISVAGNGPQPRSGAVQIAGQAYVVSQEAATPAPTPPSAPNPPPALTCTVRVNPLTLDVSAAGSRESLMLTASAASCTWTLASHAAWLSIAAPPSGSGTAPVGIAVAANTDSSPRTGTLTVASQTVTVNQAGAAAPPPPVPTCTFTVQPAVETVPAGGALREVDVRASASSCDWTAASSAPWIAITSGATGRGDDTVRYTVAANTETSPRSGALTVAGRTVTVNQGAGAPPPPPPPPPPPCTFTVSPATQAIRHEGDSRELRVDASAATCGWTASSAVEWITITAGASGTGDGQVRYTVAPNTSSSPRTGRLTAAGQTVSVTQEAPPPRTIRLEGQVAGLSGACPTLRFTVRGQLVQTDLSTEFEGSCRRIDNGDEVRVDGIVLPDNSVLATRVRAGDDD
jgi:Domain of unknown function (DUF5666)/Putative binding domain, N-terminal/Viral BACON domain